jgi:hypothetical protein
LLDLLWLTADTQRPSACCALLSYRYLHPLPSDLVEEIEALQDAYPELDALSEAGSYLGRLAGAA